MATRIIPKVKEISLAFNPANKRKFILHKDEKGGEIMKIEDLKTVEDFQAFLKEQKVSDDAAALLTDVFMSSVVQKDLKAEIEKEIKAKLEKDVRAAAEKDLREKLEKEIQAKVEKEVGMTKDAEIQKLSETVTALQKETDETKTLLMIEKDARRVTELEKEIKATGVPGDITKMAKDFLEIEKVNPELAKNVMSSYKEFGTAIKAAEVFKEHGSSGEGASGTAYEELRKIAKEEMKKDKDLSELDAFALAARQNPSLYREYNAEHYRRQVAH